jgi:predicted NAD/FAD-dependent oxidoreductase
MRVAIVGGGVAGLALANKLSANEAVMVTIFDTGQKRLGGRASSRTIDQYSFDHCLQYVTTGTGTADVDRDDEFERYLKNAALRGELVIADNERYGRLLSNEGFRSFNDSKVRYVSEDGFVNFIERLESEILKNEKNRIERPQWVGSMKQKVKNGPWTLGNTKESKSRNYREFGEFDVVVIAHNGKCAYNLMQTAKSEEENNGAQHPSPKILAALKASFGVKTREELYKKRELVLSSVWSVNVVIENLDSDDGVVLKALDAFDGAHVSDNERVAYVGNNTLKRKKNLALMGKKREITILSTPLYGRENKVPQENIPKDVAERVTNELVFELENLLRIPRGSLADNIIFSKPQLWGAANPLTFVSKDFLFDVEQNLGVCGDWLFKNENNTPSVQTAMNSGWKLADEIIAQQQILTNGTSSATKNKSALDVRWQPVKNASAISIQVEGCEIKDPPPPTTTTTSNTRGNNRMNNNNNNNNNNRTKKKPRAAAVVVVRPRALSRLLAF